MENDLEPSNSGMQTRIRLAPSKVYDGIDSSLQSIHKMAESEKDRANHFTGYFQAKYRPSNLIDSPKVIKDVKFFCFFFLNYI